MGTDGLGAELEDRLENSRLWREDGFLMTTWDEETLDDGRL